MLNIDFDWFYIIPVWISSGSGMISSSGQQLQEEQQDTLIPQAASQPNTFAQEQHQQVCTARSDGAYLHTCYSPWW